MSFKKKGMTRSRITRPAGPAALWLEDRAPNATTRSTRGRRSRSNAVKAAAGPGRSRRHLAKTSASSMAIEAPCPELGEAA